MFRRNIHGKEYDFSNSSRCNGGSERCLVRRGGAFAHQSFATWPRLHPSCHCETGLYPLSPSVILCAVLIGNDRRKCAPYSQSSHKPNLCKDDRFGSMSRRCSPSPKILAISYTNPPALLFARRAAPPHQESHSDCTLSSPRS